MLRTDFIVTRTSGAGQRLDVFLAGNIPGLTRSRIQKIIERGGVQVSGTVRKAGYKLSEDERVEIEYDEDKPEGLEPENIPLRIISSDDQVIVLDKASGLVVHPGAGRRKGTLASALVHHFPEIASLGSEERPGIVHRLDKETSGLMVVARTPDSFESLKEQFKRREVRKTYLGMVWGRMSGSTGVFTWPIGRHIRRGERISVRTRKPKEAETRFRVIDDLGEMSLLEVTPVTGRTHQIRVHLAAAGHPIVGDRRYGRKKERRKCPRLFLHAHRLSFIHPGTGKRVEFVSPLPSELKDFLEAQSKSARSFSLED